MTRFSVLICTTGFRESLADTLRSVKAMRVPLDWDWELLLVLNGTRELSDALRRRCLYHYVEYPAFDKELRIVNARVPEIGPQLARQVVAFVQELRKLDLRKKPGIAETLDWAAALLRLDVNSLDSDPQAVIDSLVCLLKTREDSSGLDRIEVERLMARAV